MKKILTEYKGYPLTPCTEAENNIMQMVDLSIHKSCCQIPVYVLTDHRIDPALFLKAVNEEIRRNDSLRMRWLRQGSGLFPTRYHYFLKEFSLAEIPELDFRGKTAEDMEAALSKDAGIPVRFEKGEVFRIRILHAPDGRDGFYIISSHMNLDMAALLICVRDLIGVYDAMEKGKPMPEPLCRYEELLELDLQKDRDIGLQEKYLQYYRDYQKKIPHPSFYAGFDRMRQLNAMRKRKKNPELRCISYSLLNNRTAADMKYYEIAPEKVRRIQSFGEQYGISFSTVIMMGLRLHLSRWNEHTDDISMSLLLNRRASLKTQRTGGCRVSANPFRAVIANDSTFAEALRELTVLQAGAIKRADLAYFRLVHYLQEDEHRDVMSANTSCFFSCLPPDYLKPVEGWSTEYRPVKLRHFPFTPYFLMQPISAEGGMSIAFIYQIHKFTEEEIDLAIRNMWKAIEMGMENPSITLNEIIDRL